MKRPFEMLVIADTHSGSRLGLTPPEWIPPDTAIVLKPMWEWYAKTVDAIGPVDMAVHVGDGVDGEGKKDDLEQLTTNTLTQAEIGYEALRRIRTRAWRLVYGTPFHTVGSYSYEEPLADALKGSIKDTQLLNIRGHNFNFRHVVGRSDTAYAQGTQLFKEAVRDQLLAELEDREAAEVVVRGHVHYYYRVENSERTAVICPCFQVPASVFGRRCRHFLYNIGILKISITKDEVLIRRIIMPLRIVVRKEYECVK